MIVPKGVVKRKFPVRAGQHPAIFNQTLGRQPYGFSGVGGVRAKAPMLR
jgi:hypothetical protein